LSDAFYARVRVRSGSRLNEYIVGFVRTIRLYPSTVVIIYGGTVYRDCRFVGELAHSLIINGKV